MNSLRQILMASPTVPAVVLAARRFIFATLGWCPVDTKDVTTLLPIALNEAASPSERVH